jgi:chromosomal replication initiation ATPase DnaA
MREKIEEEEYDEAPSWAGAVKGDEAFADRVLQMVGEPPVVPRTLTTERIAREVARSSGVDLAQMRSGSRDRQVSRARLMAAWLGRDIGRIPTARFAKYFGRAGVTLNIGLNRLDAALVDNAQLRGTLSKMSSALVQPTAK